MTQKLTGKISLAAFTILCQSPGNQEDIIQAILVLFTAVDWYATRWKCMDEQLNQQGETVADPRIKTGRGAKL